MFDEVAADLDDPVVFLLSPCQVTAPGIIFVQLLCAIVYMFGCCCLVNKQTELIVR